MKPDIIFLRELRKELRFLKTEEKEKFISEYRTKINDRYQRGEEYSNIVASFEAPKEIAKKIYQEYPFDVESIEKNSKSNNHTIKWLSSILSTVPQVIIFALSILLLAAGIIVGLGTFFVFALCWMNFDPLQAIGPALFTLGLLPLIAFGLIWIGRQLFKMESFIFKAIWKALTTKEIAKKTTQKISLKTKKILKAIFIMFCSLLTISGAVGSFAGGKTIGYSAIAGNFLHNQTETLDLSKFLEENTDPIDIYYESLKQISWYQFDFHKDSTIKNNLKISRDHNTKENLKLEYSVEKRNEKLILKVNMPWNLLVFNISSNKFNIWYNPEKLHFLH